MARPRRNDVWLLVAYGGLGLFVVAVGIEHAIVRQLSPLRHFVSEYASSSSGAVMSVGFIAWAFSLATTAVAAKGLDYHLPRVAGNVLAGFLGIAAVGLAFTAAFETDTSAGMLPPGATHTIAGRLHNAGSGAAQLALFGAAVTSACIQTFGTMFKRMVLGVGMGALLITVILLAVGPSVGGLRQRLLLAVAVAWQVLLLSRVALESRRQG